MAENRTAGVRTAVTVAVAVAVLALAGCAPVDPAGPVAVAEAEAEVARVQAEAAAAVQRHEAEVARAQRDETVARLAEQAARADHLEADRWRPFRVGAWNLLYGVVPLLLLFLALVTLGAGGWLWSRHGLVLPRKADGALPFDRRALTVDDSRAALAGRQAADLALASQQPVPHTLSYSPRSDWRNQIDGGEAAALPAVVAAQVPTFGELLGAGTIGAGKPLYLGLAAAGPLTGTWKSIYSAGVGGVQGSGKTWTGVSLTVQALLDGTDVLVIDPHAGDDESLGARLAPVERFLVLPVAGDDTAMLQVLDAVAEELQRRTAGNGGRRPRLLVIDEWTRIQRGKAAERVAEVLEAVTQEGRKLGINALLLGQRWSHTRGGGNDLRNTLTSAFVHRMRVEDARMLTGLRAEQLPKDTLQLAPGECYVQTTAGDFTRVQSPRMTGGDVVQAAAVLAASRSSTGPPAGPLPTAYPVAVDRLPRGEPVGGRGTACQDAEDGRVDGANDPMYAEARELLARGRPMQVIRDRIAGKPVGSGGRAWRAAQDRLDAILQALALESMVQPPTADEDDGG